MSKVDKAGQRRFFEEFCKRLHTPCNAFNVVRSKAIDTIASTEKFMMESTLGSLGGRMHDFFSGLDLEHPGLNQSYDGIFLDDNEFAMFVCEILSCGKHLVRKDYTRVLALLSQHAESHLLKMSKYAEIIDMPEKNRCNVRFVLDKSRRNSIRRQKKPQIIDMRGAIKKGASYFESHPENFDRHMRFDTSMAEELGRLEDKARRYEETGCSVLADEIRRNLSIYNDHVKNSYYGFNRTTISSIAIIMARSLGCVATNTGDDNGLAVRIPSETLGKPHGDSFLSYVYDPTIYPSHYFESIMPATVKSVLEHLENFPQADSKPIFDFYGIVVPSIVLPRVDGKFGYRDSMDNIVDFDDYNECKQNFDKWLVSEGIVSPIIVAEKDHKCYFLTYWV
jgi:hypothetical protein